MAGGEKEAAAETPAKATTKTEATETPAAETPATDVVAAVAAAAAAAVTSPTPSIPTKIIPATPRPGPPRDPGIPSDRDAVVDADGHKGTMLLADLVRLHYYLWKKKQEPPVEEEKTEEAIKKEESKDDKPKEDEKKEETKTPPAKVDPPTEAKDVEELATRLTDLFKSGRQYELSGLKDVPTPFFKGEGRFFEKTPTADDEMEEKKKWKRLDDDAAKSYVSGLILKSFKEFAESDNKEADAAGSEESDASEISKNVDTLFKNLDASTTGEEAPSDPRPYDVLFLPVTYGWEESMNYDHQSGNKNLLYLASQHVSNDTKESIARVKAAFALVTAEVQVSSGTELVTQNQRFVIQQKAEENATGQQKLWKNMGRDDLAEFATIFVFEVYLEKRFYEETIIGTNIVDAVGSPVTPGSTQAAMKDLLSPSDANKPSDVPIPNPTTHDVLFGRGGMTNGHPGNRRFRDIIALHRPDYVRATKMDKPNVARKIVRAIRQGNPAGRFLRKSSDGMWRDVGDKVAAEKTSQGLRERSNAEKRQRSAQRESIRIGRESLGGESADGTPAGKKMKLNGASVSIAGIVPLTLTTKKSGGSAKKSKKGINGPDEENATESLPPNAVDKDGNIMVTDHDILCGRGGLTNHHKGNKRFRDIVALHRPDYVRAPKIQKPSVARVIVRAIRNGDPPGRFLKKDATTGKWFDIGDKKAAEKTSQALREKSDEEKEGKVPAGFTSPTLIVPTAAAAANNVDAALTDAAVAATRMITAAVVDKSTKAGAKKGEEKADLSVKKEDVEKAKETTVEI